MIDQAENFDAHTLNLNRSEVRHCSFSGNQTEVEMISQHCAERAAQRGVSGRLMEAILANADVDRPVGDNCRILRVSRSRARRLNLDDRLGRYALIWSDDNAQIVTVMPVYCNRSGRRYRGGMHE